MSRTRPLRFGATASLVVIVWLATANGRAATNLAWHTAADFRFAPLAVPPTGRAGFTLLPAADTGITFSNRLTDIAVAINRLREIGSGVALGDVDGDGRVDIYFCRLQGDNVLYRNLGDWKFEDITASSGVACPNQYSTGGVLADLDGDGDLDLLVNSLGGGTRMFLNDGRGQFTERTDTQLARRFGATSLALADFDGDGDLDLYVTNYRTDTFFDNPPGLRIEQRQQPDGRMTIEPQERFVAVPTIHGATEVLERGEPDFLYLNQGGGRFAPVPPDAGMFRDEEGRPLAAPLTEWGLAVIWRDLDGDGRPDLYVCNDFVYWPDRIWLNREGRHFQAVARHAVRCVSLSSMAVDVADFNRDGFDDLFVAEMLSPHRQSRAWQRPDTLAGAVVWPVEDSDFRPEVMRNTLQLARGDGTFAEIARLAGVSATDWTWGALFLDVDLDGWEDLLVSAGANHDVQDVDAQSEIIRADGWRTARTRIQSLTKLPRRPAPSVALRNRRDLTFENVSTAWGFDAEGVAQGMALGDLDNDGDLDVVINCLNAPARLYRNESAAPRVAIRLKGAGENTRGIGARLKVSGGPVTQTQEMIAGGRYLSSDDAMRVFAAGTARALEIEVRWRSGKRSLVKEARPNAVYELDEATATVMPPVTRTVAAPLFEDVSARLNHLHVDAPFDDFARHPLLPRKLSTLGPGVAWADLNADGWDDLLIGGGKGGRLAVFRNDGKGGWPAWNQAKWPQTNERDQTSVLVWREANGPVRILAGESNWEDGDTNAPAYRVFALNTNAAPAEAPPPASRFASAGPLALADVDGDGDLDLFVGARVTTGRYPEPAPSWIGRNDHGRFSVAQRLPEAGLVSGAVFTDLDGDGDPDLVLACDWGPIRIFRNNRGELAPWNPPLRNGPTLNSQPSTLNQLTGWWNGVAVGDFDGDGRLDFVASNWGRNWRTDVLPGQDVPVQLFHGDFAGDGTVQTLLASADPQLAKVTPWRERKAVMAAIPPVAARLPSFHAYGKASVQEVLAETAATAQELRGTTFDTMVFLNRGDHFEARPLPVEAQFAPAFGVSVADFDGDGNEDVFLAQNFFGVDAETSRHDAGLGLVLLGDGRGGFRALGPMESGLVIPGEQRGSAVADFDGDGRMDLVVAQHGGATKLFRNTQARPGVRLTLRGRPANPDAIGACVRLRCGSRWGPARELHAGAGYWSQDSSTLVLATPSTPNALQVRWPTGKTQEWPWPAGATTVRVSTDGIEQR